MYQQPIQLEEAVEVLDVVPESIASPETIEGCTSEGGARAESLRAMSQEESSQLKLRS